MVKMVTVSIDGHQVQVPATATILAAASKAKVAIPHLCYMGGINEVNACKVCVVEVQGRQRLVSACTAKVEEGMAVLTASPRARQAQRTNTELLLSQHHCHCPSCPKEGSCPLQKLAAQLGIDLAPRQEEVAKRSWDEAFPLIRREEQCVKCFRCVNVCAQVQTMGVWQPQGSGSRTTVGVRGGLPIAQAPCTLCGQCINYCPAGALLERDDLPALEAALAKKKASIALATPALRAALGEAWGLRPEALSQGQLLAAVTQLGFDYVWDNAAAVAAAAREEAACLAERLQHKAQHSWPLFSATCPVWTSYLGYKEPRLAAQLSPARSPQQLFGALAKGCLVPKLGLAPEELLTVALVPCLAKKGEADRGRLSPAGGREVDLALTPVEVVRLIRAKGLTLGDLAAAAPPAPQTAAPPAGNGSQVERVLTAVYRLLTGEEAPPSALQGGRAVAGRRDYTVEVNGLAISACTVIGQKNAVKLLDDIQAKKAHYDYVEVLACPGGCLGSCGCQLLPPGCKEHCPASCS